jgi:hypothetical protein
VVGVIRIGSPLAGRTVTLISGHTFGACSRRNSKRRLRLASAIVASCRANDEPMQMRGPAPKGKASDRTPGFTQKPSGIEDVGLMPDLPPNV